MITLKGLLDHTDLVLFDIKCFDSIKHVGTTGKKNDLIIENVKKVAKNKTMKFRVSLMLGFNASREDLRAFFQEESMRVPAWIRGKYIQGLGEVIGRLI